MNPVLRALGDDGPTPEGWRAEPAGRWAGRDVEIVYDPRRHDVLVATNGLPERQWEAFRAAGFELIDVAGRDELWIRDRVAVARAGLARVDTAAAAVGAPGLTR